MVQVAPQEVNVTFAALVTSLSLSIATAQDVVEDGGAADTPPTEAASAKGVNLRYRYLFLPSGVLDSWYYRPDESTLDFPRPGISAHVIGGEFALEPAPASFLIWAEYWKVNWQEGYWDDREDTKPDHGDGDWLAPTKLGMVAVGANFGREFAVTNADNDVWLGFLLSGGFGLGILTGRVDQWKPGFSTDLEAPPDCGAAMPAYNRKDVCDPDSALKLPPVAPVIDLTLGWRLNISETANVRIEAGLHDMIFVGGGAGAVF